MNLYPIDEELVRAFIRREMEDYRQYATSTTQEQTEIVDEHFVHIKEACNNFPEKSAWSIHLRSFTNMGQTARELELESGGLPGKRIVVQFNSVSHRQLPNVRLVKVNYPT